MLRKERGYTNEPVSKLRKLAENKRSPFSDVLIFTQDASDCTVPVLSAPKPLVFSEALREKLMGAIVAWDIPTSEKICQAILQGSYETIFHFRQFIQEQMSVHAQSALWISASERYRTLSLKKRACVNEPPARDEEQPWFALYTLANVLLSNTNKSMVRFSKNYDIADVAVMLSQRLVPFVVLPDNTQSIETLLKRISSSPFIDKNTSVAFFMNFFNCLAAESAQEDICNCSMCTTAKTKTALTKRRVIIEHVRCLADNIYRAFKKCVHITDDRYAFFAACITDDLATIHDVITKRLGYITKRLGQGATQVDIENKLLRELPIQKGMLLACRYGSVQVTKSLYVTLGSIMKDPFLCDARLEYMSPSKRDSVGTGKFKPSSREIENLVFFMETAVLSNSPQILDFFVDPLKRTLRRRSRGDVSHHNQTLDFLGSILIQQHAAEDSGVSGDMALVTQRREHGGEQGLLRTTRKKTKTAAFNYRTFLRFAINSNMQDLLFYLVENHPDKKNQAAEAIGLAFIYKNYEVLPRLALSCRDFDRWSAIFSHACKTGNIKLVKFLMNNCHLITWEGIPCSAGFFEACFAGNLEIAQFLWNAPHSVIERDRDTELLELAMDTLANPHTNGLEDTDEFNHFWSIAPETIVQSIRATISSGHVYMLRWLWSVIDDEVKDMIQKEDAIKDLVHFPSKTKKEMISFVFEVILGARPRAKTEVGLGVIEAICESLKETYQFFNRDQSMLLGSNFDWERYTLNCIINIHKDTIENLIQVLSKLSFAEATKDPEAYELYVFEMNNLVRELVSYMKEKDGVSTAQTRETLRMYMCNELRSLGNEECALQIESAFASCMILY